MSKFCLKRISYFLTPQIYNTLEAISSEEDDDVRHHATVRAVGTWFATSLVIFGMIYQYNPELFTSCPMKQWLDSVDWNLSISITGWCIALIILPLLGDLVTRGIGYDAAPNKVDQGGQRRSYRN